MAAMKYALFLGCLIPFKEMSYEASGRRVAKELGIELHDMPDANCCGLPIDPMSHEMMMLLAARNLCIAEKMGLSITSLCNGCVCTLTKVNKMLKRDRDLRKHINSQLSSIGMEFQGKIEVKHFAQILLDMGPDALKKFITRPLNSLNVAAFTGCHFFRPSEFMEVKNPEEPTVLHDLIELTGAKSVRYPDEFQCCGASEGAIDNRLPIFLGREKLRNAKKAGADAMVTICPACHQVLEGNQRMVERQFSESYNLPVLHYPQLLGLAMGIPPEELALKELRIRPDKVLSLLTKA